MIDVGFWPPSPQALANLENVKLTETDEVFLGFCISSAGITTLGFFEVGRWLDGSTAVAVTQRRVRFRCEAVSHLDRRHAVTVRVWSSEVAGH
eukprot:8916052-Pyramimonas_sp.AAC.1